LDESVALALALAGVTQIDDLGTTVELCWAALTLQIDVLRKSC
jgi:hypothetical protein